MDLYQVGRFIFVLPITIGSIKDDLKLIDPPLDVSKSGNSYSVNTFTREINFSKFIKVENNTDIVWYNIPQAAYRNMKGSLKSPQILKHSPPIKGNIGNLYF